MVRNQPYIQLTHARRSDPPDGWPYMVRLITTPQPFGGLRWWFECPRTFRRSVRLFLPCGGHQFWSRHSYGLGYACQRESAMDRAWRRGSKLYSFMGGKNTTGETIHCRGPKACAFEPTNGRPPSWRLYTSGTTGDGEPARCALLLDSTGFVVNQPVRQNSVTTIWTAIASPRAEAAIGTSTSFATRLMCRRARRYSGRRSAGQRN
jgi:hypothetical protein